MKKKAAVIGSGFGGLAVAIRLQSKGFQVTVFEKNAIPGGHAYQLKKDGYTFDMGPSLITAPDIIQKVFASADRRMEDYLDLVPVDPFYRIYFHDGSYLDYSGDSDSMKKQMEKFNERDAANYDKFIAKTRELHKAVITDGLGSRPFSSWGTMLRFLPQALKLNALISAYAFARKYFKDPRHQFAFSFHPLFIGGSPFRAPAVYQMIPYLEKQGGVWFSKGGMYSLVQAFQKAFTEIGGEMKLNSEVQEIKIKDRQVQGVTVNDKFHEADLVISNADFHHTYGKLIKPEFRKKWTDRKLSRMGYSMSAYLLYLGVKKTFPKLLHHTLILSQRYRDLVKDIFDRKILPEDFSMYLHVPTRTDESMAPGGAESMYVLIPVANLDSGINWAEKVGPFTDKVIDFLENDFGLEGLRENIEVLETFTPEDFKNDRNNHLGSAWGVEPKLTQTAVFRPHNKSEDIDGLYLVGTSTHPGAGVPGVLLTAEATEYVVLQDLGISSNGYAPESEVSHHEVTHSS
ncbi:MAG: phytoene desaturase [Calditrichaeota bacterium]|nr:MAG: phytoene desaturase [Calditrichota bacterium]